MKQKSVLVAFSGGIDSCAAVDILRSEGYAVEAMTIDMLGDNTLLNQAKTSAERLQLKLHIIDAKKLFHNTIIENFIGEYMSGRTPAPCTLCNTEIKWKLLAQKADELGIDNIATGHYFSIQKVNDKFYISRAADSQKDQSYYLWGVSQDILARARTPLASRIKSVIKETSALKKESMGICFLKGKHYTDFLCNDCNRELPTGDIIEFEAKDSAKIVGRHNGIARYTIGQKRGEGIPTGKRVIEIDAKQNQIVVGENSRLFTTELKIERVVCTDKAELEAADNLQVMVRGLGLNPEGYAKIKFAKNSDTEATITLERSAWAIAPGQPITLYIDDRVVGGGYQTLS